MRLAVILTLLFIKLVAEGCHIEIDSVRQIDDRYIVSFKYDKECILSIEHNSSTQVVISSRHKQNVSSSASIPFSDTYDSTIESILKLAHSKIGSRYQPAKAGPDRFDCSGFVYYLFTQNGIKIPRTSLEQSQIGKKLSRDELKRGDLVFFDTYNRHHINHSGIYLGDGKFIHSTSGRAYGVTISDLDHGFYKDKFRWGVRPPIKRDTQPLY